MLSFVVKGAAVLAGIISMHTVGMHQGPIKVLRVGRNRIVLPFRAVKGPSAEMARIERVALSVTEGGQIKGITPSVWVGKPVWMVTVVNGTNVWHVMVDRQSLEPISKVMVPRH